MNITTQARKGQKELEKILKHLEYVANVPTVVYGLVGKGTILRRERSEHGTVVLKHLASQTGAPVEAILPQLGVARNLPLALGIRLTPRTQLGRPAREREGRLLSTMDGRTKLTVCSFFPI